MEATDDDDDERNNPSSFAAVAAGGGGGASGASPVEEDTDDNDSEEDDEKEEEDDEDDEDNEDGEEQEEGSEEEDRKMPALVVGASIAAAGSITTSSATAAATATSSSRATTTTTTTTSGNSTTSGSITKGKRKQSAIMGLSPDERWEEMFQRLTKFKEMNGHCQVPNRYREDASLGCWVSTQRRLHKKAQQHKGEGLNPERTARLEQLGFEWTGENPRHKNWDIRYEELKAFKAKYGHAQVPIGFEDNVQLANWTSTQRQEYKNLLKGKPSRLSKERIKLLNDIGFAWELQRGGRRRLVTTRASDSSRSSSASGKNTASVVLPGVALLGGDQRLKRVVPKRTSSTSSSQIDSSPSTSAVGTGTSTKKRSGNAPAPLPALPEGSSVATTTTTSTPTQSASVARAEINPISRIQAETSSLVDTAMLPNMMMHNRNAFGRIHQGTNHALSASQILLGGHSALTAAQLTPYQQALLRQTAQSQATMPFNPLLLSNNINMSFVGQTSHRAPMSLLQSLVQSTPASLHPQQVSSATMSSAMLSNAAIHRAAVMLLQQQHQQQQQQQQQQIHAAASAMLPPTLQAMSRSAGSLVEAKSEDMVQQSEQQQHNRHQQQNNQEPEERWGSSSAPPKKRKYR